MSSLRENLLRQHLHAELAKARLLEKQGKIKEAGVHYTRAGAIYRRIAYNAPPQRAEEIFSTASQYETLGNTIKNQEKITEMKRTAPEVYESAIESLIVSTKPETTWEDIGGLPEVKRTIKEAIIIPFIQNKPPFVRSPRTILLYGPPGTGKTLLAKASTNTLSATFFEARSSALLSKYFGESGKLISALFNKAEKLQPSVIFIDEIDSLAVARTGQVSEASRRVLGQLLTEMEGFSTKKEEKILIMGATNKPWDLDDAMVSRFQRRIYVPLPDEKARKNIIKIHLNGAEVGKISIDELVERTKGFSGRDIANLCQEAINLMIRESNPGLDKLTIQELEHYSLRSRQLSKEDFESAFENVRPTSQQKDLDKYEKWKEEFGG